MSDTHKTNVQLNSAIQSAKDSAKNFRSEKAFRLAVERESEQWQAAAERLRACVVLRDEEMQYQARLAMDARSERDQWRAVAEQLYNAGGSYDRYHEACDAYEKLKETI